MAQTVKSPPAMQENWVQSLGWDKNILELKILRIWSKLTLRFPDPSAKLERMYI